MLIGQCLYYNALHWRRTSAQAAAPKPSPDEHTPLLDGDGRPPAPLQPPRKHSFTDVTSTNLGLPGSRRRSSAASSNQLSRHRTTSTASLPPIAEARPDSRPSPDRAVLKNALSVVGILAIGTLGWFIAYQTGAWQPTPVGHEDDGERGGDATPLGAEILGYVSAVAYLGARVPQIVKNWRERSCEGTFHHLLRRMPRPCRRRMRRQPSAAAVSVPPSSLSARTSGAPFAADTIWLREASPANTVSAGLSLLFFLLSLLGNLTYGAGILFHSVDAPYLLTNLPWLLGSFGTIGEDAFIFVQFRMYGRREEGDGEVAVVVEEDGAEGRGGPG